MAVARCSKRLATEHNQPMLNIDGAGTQPSTFAIVSLFSWHQMRTLHEHPFVFFFFTLVTGPRRSLSLKLSDTRVYEPQIRARLGTTRAPRRNSWGEQWLHGSADVSAVCCIGLPLESLIILLVDVTV